ncbi:hypothetical protein BSLA_01f3511 [Burkholderia stabilis]|nr:hypothetical protein BSLA_01f3511 [Burkholderia stabilis]
MSDSHAVLPEVRGEENGKERRRRKGCTHPSSDTDAYW